LIKLLYISTNLNSSGGVSRVLSVKLNYLLEEFGYDIYIINTNGKSGKSFYNFNKRIHISFLKPSKLRIIHFFTYRKKLNLLIKDIKPDIVINCDNGLKGSIFPYLVNIMAPVIYERHCSKNIFVVDFFERFKLILSNIILSTNINIYKYFIVLNSEERLDWNYSNVKVISNPIWFNQPKTVRLKKNNVIIAVGRFSPEKGYENLLKIWKLVADKYPDWILKIYGEGNYDGLNKFANNLNILDNIQLCNPEKNIENIYENAQMLLNTSKSEAFGLSIIEGMAFGLPVISFDNISGAKSSIVNGENGYAIKKDDLKAYAEKVIYLIENEDDRDRISKNAKQFVKKYNLEAIMYQWHLLYQSMC